MTDPGLYRCHCAPFAAPRPAIFFDRDGVLVEETHYLHTVEALQIIPGSTDAIRLARNHGYAPIIITNQAGIGRGYYSWSDFAAVQTALSDLLARDGAMPDGVWACAYHPEGKPPFNRDHNWRKPNPGMLLDAAAQLQLHLNHSWVIGDKLTDLQAGIAAGVGGAILVKTGYGWQMQDRLSTLAAGSTQLFAAADAFAAVQKILHLSRL